MRTVIRMTCAAVMCVSLASTAATGVNMETASVGNVGNPGDVQSQGTFGAVDYIYNIGKYEVTAGQYVNFLNKVAGVDTYGLYSDRMWTRLFGCKIERYQGAGTGGDPYRYRVDPARANRPVNWVSWGDAMRFANWLHNDQPEGLQNADTTEDGAYSLHGATSDSELFAVNREPDWKWAITSEDEWYKAAYHKNNGATGDYFNYPTATNTHPSNDLIDPDPGNNATYYIHLGGSNMLSGDFTIGEPYWCTEVGAHENSASPYNTFDQGGNVWEWNEGRISRSYGDMLCLRGSSYNFSTAVDYLRGSYRNPRVATHENDYIGFRVVQTPEPATLCILTFGGLAVLRRRRREAEVLI